MATALLTLMIATVVWRAQERLSTKDSVGNDPERRPGRGQVFERVVLSPHEIGCVFASKEIGSRVTLRWGFLARWDVVWSAKASESV